MRWREIKQKWSEDNRTYVDYDDYRNDFQKIVFSILIFGAILVFSVLNIRQCSRLSEYGDTLIGEQFHIGDTHFTVVNFNGNVKHKVTAIGGNGKSVKLTICEFKKLREYEQ